MAIHRCWLTFHSLRTTIALFQEGCKHLPLCVCCGLICMSVCAGNVHEKQKRAFVVDLIFLLVSVFPLAHTAGPERNRDKQACICEQQLDLLPNVADK